MLLLIESIFLKKMSLKNSPQISATMSFGFARRDSKPENCIAEPRSPRIFSSSLISIWFPIPTAIIWVPISFATKQKKGKKNEYITLNGTSSLFQFSFTFSHLCVYYIIRSVYWFLYRFHFTAHNNKSFLGRPVLLSNLSS